MGWGWCSGWDGSGCGVGGWVDGSEVGGVLVRGGVGWWWGGWLVGWMMVCWVGMLVRGWLGGGVGDGVLGGW